MFMMVMLMVMFMKFMKLMKLMVMFMTLMDGHEDQDVQDDCDQDAVANMEDICPCDPTKSITDLHGLVPHEV